MRKSNQYRSQVRECVFKVAIFFTKLQSGDVCLKDCGETELKQYVSSATGVSLSTVYNILKEAAGQMQDDVVEYAGTNDQPSTSTAAVQFESPRRRAKARCSTITNLDDFDLGAIRRIIHSFHLSDKSNITLRNLHEKLQSDLSFTGSVSSVRRIIKKLGFKWKTAKDNRGILMEKEPIRLKRVQYLRRIAQFREKGYAIVYTDETYVHTTHHANKRWCDDSNRNIVHPMSKGQRFIVVHAGSEEGFIKKAFLCFKSGKKSGDYHDDMNSENFLRCFTTQLIPNLKQRTVLVIDNAPYHNVKLNPAPNSNALKQDMRTWLDAKRIQYPENILKSELYDIIKAHKEKYTEFKLDRLMEQHCHRVLRLPPYHPELNPIENIWGIVKNRIALANVEFTSTKIEQIIKDEFDKVSSEEWRNTCRHIWDQENKFIQQEHVMDNIIDEIILRINETTTTDTSSN